LLKDVTAECLCIEDIIRNTRNEVEVSCIGLFLEEVSRKFFLALRYWVTFTLPAVVPRHTVYRLRPLCPRVAGWNRLVLSVTYFGCERDMTGVALQQTSDWINHLRYQLSAGQVFYLFHPFITQSVHYKTISTTYVV
jgi:hypothetical protein